MEKSERRYIPNATRITENNLKDFHNVQLFFKNLIANSVVVVKDVGNSFEYPADVTKQETCGIGAHGLFINYFIRKHLSNQYNIEITDSRTERVLKNSIDYNVSQTFLDSLKRHYKIFKDLNSKAIDIIESIKIVSLSNQIVFHDPIPNKYSVNEKNLQEIIRYLESLPYKSVDLNPQVDCDYFNGDADFIYDNNVIYEIKTSKYKCLMSRQTEVPLCKFYKPLLYAFGFYKNTGIKINNFKIYNPLLGCEYSLELKNIDFILFEKNLKIDVEKFIRIYKTMQDRKEKK